MKRLNLRVPLIVAPMAGGPSSPELVVASSKAGALGSIGAAYSTPAAIEAFAQTVRSETRNPIAINLFIPHGRPQLSEQQIATAVQATARFRTQLGLPTPHVQAPFEEDFDNQFATVLKLKPAVFSYVFGILRSEYVKALKKEGILVFGTATTVDEAQELADSGADAITLQGFEAGGHRGLFDASAVDPEVPLFKLLDQCHAKIKVPLIAAGGLMTKADVQAALKKGAAAVQLGTAFLACKEAGTSAPYRRSISVPERTTKTTRAFSGRLARGVENRFMREIDIQPEAILPFPAQNQFTRDIRTASAKQDSSDFLSLWCGTGAGVLWTGAAADLIDQLF